MYFDEIEASYEREDEARIELIDKLREPNYKFIHKIGMLGVFAEMEVRKKLIHERLYVITQDNRYRYTVKTTEQQVIEWINELNWIDTPITGGWDFEEAEISPSSVIEARIIRNKRIGRQEIRYITLELLSNRTEANKQRFKLIEPYIDMDRLAQSDTLKYVNEAKEIIKT